MGILNVTPDSFFDGGKFIDKRSILLHVEKMITEGADIIDIGACSTRPNAKEISEQEELKRLIPAIKLVRKKFPDVIISADTFRSKVAEEAVNAGADMINDISGGGFVTQSTVTSSPSASLRINSVEKSFPMFQIIAKLKVPYVLMHIQGTPQTMQTNPQYKDVVKEVKEYFKERVGKLKVCSEGVPSGKVGQIILDPGFGFGKTTEHNYALLKHLAEFKEFGFPILAGVSRKSMISKATAPSNSPEEGELRRVIPPSGGRGASALNGTTAANTIALMNGANILRVHDVKEAKEAIQIVTFATK